MDTRDTTGGGKHKRSLGLRRGSQRPPTSLSYSQLRARGIKLSPHGDVDGDKVPNIADCRPLDPKKHGNETIADEIHRDIQWREQELEALEREGKDEENSSYYRRKKAELDSLMNEVYASGE